MYLGRYTLGNFVLIPLQAVNALQGPVLPTQPPGVTVLDDAMALILADLMPAADPVRSPGLFGYRLGLDSSFQEGRYMIALTYAAAGVSYLQTACFDVVPGGTPDGNLVSVHHLERPHARYLVTKSDTGKRYFKRNPYL